MAVGGVVVYVVRNAQRHGVEEGWVFANLTALRVVCSSEVYEYLERRLCIALYFYVAR
jgi:hypothetical protein